MHVDVFRKVLFEPMLLGTWGSPYSFPFLIVIKHNRENIFFSLRNVTAAEQFLLQLKYIQYNQIIPFFCLCMKNGNEIVYYVQIAKSKQAILFKH